MSLVTDVKWECPNCGLENIAQLYDHVYPDDDYENKPLPRKAIPSNALLKWNPPCKKCGKYKLVDPPVLLIEFPIERVVKD